MTVGILGAGAYGLSLGLIINDNGHKVKMWTKFDNEVQDIADDRESSLLPGIHIDEKIEVTTDFAYTVQDADLIVIAVPAAFVGAVAAELKPLRKISQHICIATKGIEQESCLFVCDVVKQHIKTKKIGVISGPTFAIDVANKVPIGLSLGSKHKVTTRLIKESLQNSHVKLKETNDILGIEICGSIKNVIAIANGMLDGMGLPISTQALMITESLNDIKWLIYALGGNKKTILTYAGFGDLLLTCTSTKSRNFSFGRLLGSGATQEEIDVYISKTTIEGLYTLKSIHRLLKKKKVKMPIINLVYDIIYNGQKPEELKKFLIEKVY